jgi:putative membrane protein
MVGANDQKFMVEAAQAGMMEVQLAQLAQEKASSDEVKQFAKQLEQDHSKANDELKEIAKQKNVDLPADMGPKHQSHMAKLQSKSGDEFDRAYMKLMVDDHKKDVSKFKKQSEKAMDSHVKEFAAKTLPHLQAHLEKAQALNTQTRSRRADDSTNAPSDTSSPRDVTSPRDTTSPTGPRDPSGQRDPSAPRINPGASSDSDRTRPGNPTPQP